MSPASSSRHQARASEFSSGSPLRCARSTSMVTRATRAGLLASGNLAAHPKRAEKDQAGEQHDASGREGNVLVAGGVVRVMAHAVVDHQADDGQERKQEETQEPHSKGHENTGDETQVAQRDAEKRSPCLWGPNLLQVLLRIHNWPRKGKCSP